MDEITRRLLLKKISLISSQQPGYRIYRHPRAFDKPISCQRGYHKPVTRLINGIPSLVCKKCGAFLYKGIWDKTWSKGDMEKAARLTETKRNRTKEEIMKEIWEKQQESKKKRIEESIAKFVRERMQLIE